MGGIGNFSTFTYKTADGETIKATTNNGVVTLVGDKNGVRHLPLENFKREFLTNIAPLERTPDADAVNLSVQKAGVGAIAGGLLVGSAVNQATNIPNKLYTPKIMDKILKISSTLSPEDTQTLNDAANKAIKASGLDAKGVEIIKASANNSDDITKIMTKEVDKSLFRFLPEKIKKRIASLFSSQMASGKNACYTFASKKIVMPENKLGLAFFHEAGHAMNANLSKIGRVLQKCRPAALLALPISAIALLKTKKAQGEQPTGKIDKATNFIKENAGKLTFAAFLPMLIEEGLATIKGNKLAKQFLKPELAKKVAKTNALAFTTYLMGATLSGLGIFLGTKAKDAIAHNKLVPKNQA